MTPAASGIFKTRALAAALVLLCSAVHGQQQSAPASAGPAATTPAPEAPAKAIPATPPNAAPAPTPATKSATATPIDVKKSELGEPVWNPRWDLIVENALPPSMLSDQVPRDVRRFCPRFYRMSDVNKRAFWAYFFQALAGAEAGLNPTSHVRHTSVADDARDAVTHEPMHCEGLLQLAYEDRNRYDCSFNWDYDRKLKPGDPARTILQPRNNLECGVKILTRQIIDNHEPLFTKLSYWATLHPGTASFRVFARQMTSPPRACDYPSRKHRILDWVVAATSRFPH